MQRLLKRGALQDEQQEELSIYEAESREMDQQLRRVKSSSGATDDETSKMLHRKRAAHRALFLAGAAKRDLVQNRRAEGELRDQYYGYMFA